MRTLPMIAIVVTMACASGSTASGGTDSDVAEVAAGEPFRLAMGEGARLADEDLTVRFVAVAGDSRCPTDVTCFWAGDAQVELRVTRGDETAPVSLHSHGGKDYPRQASALGCNLRLEDLEPYPKSTTKIAPEDYVVILELTAEGASETED